MCLVGNFHICLKDLEGFFLTSYYCCRFCFSDFDRVVDWPGETITDAVYLLQTKFHLTSYIVVPATYPLNSVLPSEYQILLQLLSKIQKVSYLFLTHSYSCTHTQYTYIGSYLASRYLCSRNHWINSELSNLSRDGAILQAILPLSARSNISEYSLVR